MVEPHSRPRWVSLLIVAGIVVLVLAVLAVLTGAVRSTASAGISGSA